MTIFYSESIVTSRDNGRNIAPRSSESKSSVDLNFLKNLQANTLRDAQAIRHEGFGERLHNDFLEIFAHESGEPPPRELYIHALSTFVEEFNKQLKPSASTALYLRLTYGSMDLGPEGNEIVKGIEDNYRLGVENAVKNAKEAIETMVNNAPGTPKQISDAGKLEYQKEIVRRIEIPGVFRGDEDGRMKVSKAEIFPELNLLDGE